MSREACWVFVGSEIFYDHRLQISVGVAALRGLRSYFTGWTKFYCGQSFRGQLFISPPLIRIPIPSHKKPVVKGKAREEGIFEGQERGCSSFPLRKYFIHRNQKEGWRKFHSVAESRILAPQKYRQMGDYLSSFPFEEIHTKCWKAAFEVLNLKEEVP